MAAQMRHIESEEGSSGPSCLDSDLDGEEPKNGDREVQGEEGRPAARAAPLPRSVDAMPDHSNSLDAPIEPEEGSSWPPYFECCPGMDPTFDSDNDWEDEKWDESGNLVHWPHRSAREEEPEYNSSGGGPPARSAEKKPQRRRSRRTRHRPPRKSICEEGNVWGQDWEKQPEQGRLHKKKIGKSSHASIVAIHNGRGLCGLGLFRITAGGAATGGMQGILLQTWTTRFS